MKQSWFNFIILILVIITLFIMFEGIISLGEAISIIVLTITAFVIAKQAKATEAVAKYQLTPLVDMNMRYDENFKKTYFWFSNSSNIPALISLRLKISTEKKERSPGPYRIAPNLKSLKTSTVFFDNKIHTEGVEIVVYISIKPDFYKPTSLFPEVKLKKSYIFHNNRWDERTFGYPDPPFPLIESSSQPIISALNKIKNVLEDIRDKKSKK